jgi:hypothetical protein
MAFLTFGIDCHRPIKITDQAVNCLEKALDVDPGAVWTPKCINGFADPCIAVQSSANAQTSVEFSILYDTAPK